MASIGENAKVFLGTNTMSSNQRWTLNSDGKLQNHYGDCVTHNDANDVFIGLCNNSPSWTYSDKDLTVMPRNAQHLCLTMNGGKQKVKNGGK